MPRHPGPQNFLASRPSKLLGVLVPCKEIRKDEGDREKICKTRWEQATKGRQPPLRLSLPSPALLEGTYLPPINLVATAVEGSGGSG
jgi:hypothetical protein